MSLRRRLVSAIGLALLLLWGATAAWMLRDLEARLRTTLDQRLAMSARMVANLMAQNPAAWQAGVNASSAPPVSIAAGKGIACQVSSLRGEVYAHTAEARPEALAAARDGYAEVTMGGERWRTFAVTTSRFRVTTADRLAEREALLRDATLAAALPFGVALVGGLVMLAVGVRRGLRPLERLRLALEARAPEALEPMREPAMPRELRPLVATLNSLLERAARAIARERRFTSDAAHELRTPLTAIVTHLQVARITRGEEAAASIAQAQEGAARLQRTLAQLLTLSQVEGPFSWDDGLAASAAEVLREAVAASGAAASGRIEAPVEPPAARLAVPSALAVIALRNVIDNAVRYSPPDRPVTIEVEAGERSVSYVVADRGKGLDAEERVLATRRFWRKGEGTGSGLGLSIVAAIVERFAGSFTLRPRPGGGVEARIVLPRAPA